MCCCCGNKRKRVDDFISSLTCKKPGLFCLFAQVIGTPGHTSQNRDKSRKTGTYGHPSLVQKTRTKAPCINSVSIVRGGFCPGGLSRGLLSGRFCPGWFLWFTVLSEYICYNRKLNSKHHFKFHVLY